MTNKETTLSLLIFSIIFLGDGLDGLTARKFKQETKFGKIFDAVTDTLFIYLALIMLTLQNKLRLLFLIFLILPRFISFLKFCYNYHLEKKPIYDTSKYRRMSGLLVYILIFMGLLRPEIDTAATLVIIATYVSMIFEYFKY